MDEQEYLSGNEDDLSVLKTFNDCLNKERSKLYELNTLIIMDDAKKDKTPGYLKIKIENESKRKNYNFKDILEKIRNDHMYASMFAKEPIKQNLAENLQLKFLKERNKNIIKLPSTGKGAYYLSNGSLITNQKHKPLKTCKSMDFYDPDSKIFYYAKYTNQSGGSQDNQFNDLKNFINECLLYIKNSNREKNDDYYFVILVDGDYYNREKFKILKTLIGEIGSYYIKVINSV